jgi:hypothetical protein
VTDAEQLLAALIIDEAAQQEDKSYRGPVADLQQRTVGTFSLDAFSGAFQAALDFLEACGIAKIHRYRGVDDYVSINGGDQLDLSLRLLRNESDENVFTFEGDPKYKVLDSYLDLGSGWLHDVARALKNDTGDTPQDSSGAIRSDLWTGRYSVPEPKRVEIRVTLKRMREEIEASSFSNVEKANALAAISAIEALEEAPDPAWAIIVRLLQSPVLANLTALAALIVSIIKP